MAQQEGKRIKLLIINGLFSMFIIFLSCLAMFFVARCRTKRSIEKLSSKKTFQWLQRVDDNTFIKKVRKLNFSWSAVYWTLNYIHGMRTPVNENKMLKFMSRITQLCGQRFHNVFAYGCPDRGREFDKKSDKELFKRLHNICNYYWPLLTKRWSFWRKFPSTVEALFAVKLF